MSCLWLLLTPHARVQFVQADLPHPGKDEPGSEVSVGAACSDVEEGLAGEAGGFGELVVGHAGVGLVHLEGGRELAHVGFGWGAHSRYRTGVARACQHKMLYRMCVRCQDDPCHP